MKKLLVLLLTVWGCQPGPTVGGSTSGGSSSSSESSSSSSESSSSGSSSSASGQYLDPTSVCYRSIPNQGRIKPEILNALTDFARAAPDQLFEKNDAADIYWLFNKNVGPITSLKQRRAIMVDTLIVLGAMESSWSYTAGRDPATSPNKPCNEWEAGMFQTSSNTLTRTPELMKLFQVACKDYRQNQDDCTAFQACTKAEPAFAVSYTALLLRNTTEHHGPIKNGFVGPLLSKACENQLEAIL